MNKTYIKKKSIYNNKRCIKSLMIRENIDEERAMKINNINHKIKDLKNQDPEKYKESPEYIKIFDEKLSLLGEIPEMYKERMAIKNIIKTKKLTPENAQAYYLLSKQLLSFPKTSQNYKAAWIERKNLSKKNVIVDKN